MYKPRFGYGFDFGSVLYFGLVYTLFGNFGNPFQAKKLNKLELPAHFL